MTSHLLLFILSGIVIISSPAVGANAVLLPIDSSCPVAEEILPCQCRTRGREILIKYVVQLVQFFLYFYFLFH